MPITVNGIGNDVKEITVDNVQIFEASVDGDRVWTKYPIRSVLLATTGSYFSIYNSRGDWVRHISASAGSTSTLWDDCAICPSEKPLVGKYDHLQQYDINGNLIFALANTDSTDEFCYTPEEDILFVDYLQLRKYSKTGSIIWTYSRNETESVGCDSSGNAYIGYSDSYVRKINSSGSYLWSEYTSEPVSMVETFPSGGCVYREGTDGVQKLSSSGVVEWTNSTNGEDIEAIGVGWDGHVVVVTDTARVIKYDGATGTTLWTVQIDTTATRWEIGIDPSNCIYVTSFDYWKLESNGNLIYRGTQNSYDVGCSPGKAGTFPGYS